MIFSARCGSAPMRPMSQTPVPAASASSPGDLNGTYFIGTPRRDAISLARSGATPWGSPVALLPVTSKKFERLMPARSTPVGASSETISGDIEGVAPREGRANKCGRHPMLARSSEAIAVNPECRVVHNVRFWHKTDMAIALNDVRFWGQSGHRSDVTKCPLLTVAV